MDILKGTEPKQWTIKGLILYTGHDMLSLELGNVKIMADTYTMQFASEKYGNLVTYADDIAHMHLSSPDRGFPYLDDNHDYSGLFKTLSEIGYNKTLTIEAFHPDNFEEGAEKTYAFLVENMKKCGLTRE